MVERGTRFERSVLTFGVGGRLAVSGMVLLPLLLMLSLGLVGVIGAGMWGFFVLPPALRDVWRPAALPATDLTRLRDQARRERENRERVGLTDRGGDGIGDRPGQRRW